MKRLYDLACEFNKRFTSGNSVPVDRFMKVPTNEWEELFKIIRDKVNQDSDEQNQCPVCDNIDGNMLHTEVVQTFNSLNYDFTYIKCSKCDFEFGNRHCSNQNIKNRNHAIRSISK